MKEKSVERMIYLTKLGLPITAIAAAGKVVIGVMAGSVFMFLNAFYSVGIIVAKLILLYSYKKIKAETAELTPQKIDYTSGILVSAKNEPPPKSILSAAADEKHYEQYYAVGVILLVASLCYVAYSGAAIFFPRASNYTQIMGIAIAAITFTELVMSIRGVVLARKSKNILIEALKLINLASSLISLALTQTALLSFTTPGGGGIFNAVGGIAFGALATAIGVYMIFYTNKKRKNHEQKTE